MSLPFGLQLYRMASATAGGLAPGVLRARAAKGKEDLARLSERLGVASAPRPEGPLVWLHAASVGESQVARLLIEALAQRRPDLAFLLTTGTVTSARLAAQRPPPRTIHQFAPVDMPSAVAAFLDHWRPDAGVFLESELWPNLLLEAASRGVRLALLNARMTGKSARGWGRVPQSAQRVLSTFSVIQAADTRTADALTRLAGREIACPGNLKLAAPAPPVDPAASRALTTAISARPAWLAASTHPGEDAIIAEAHLKLTMAAQDALLILAPRHPDRADDLARELAAQGLICARRSRGETPRRDQPIWLWDTLGELGIAYAASPVSLVAGSLAPGIGGHNPIEPAQLGSPILTGPNVHNFEDVFDALVEADACTVVLPPDADALARSVAGVWGDPASGRAMAGRARSLVAGGAGVLDAALAALAPLLEARP